MADKPSAELKWVAAALVLRTEELIFMVQVIQPGRDVAINGHPATILGVWLDGVNVKYQVSWWNGADRKVEWIHDHEIDDDVPKKIGIGFTNGGTNP